ncbi:tetratricopeptide repeat protein, partial [bacterium]|nr:tetratricopeptide repeat protein [bacterium]
LLNTLGDLHRHEGALDEAKKVLGEALELGRSALGEQHLAFAGTLNNLANVAISTGDFAEAKELFERSIAIKRALLGEKHFRIAKALNNLVVVETNLGESDAAIAHGLEAIAIMRPVVGDRHPDLGRSLNSLAGVEMEAGLLVEAEAHAQEALEIAQAAGGTPLDVANAAGNLGSIYAQQGRFDDAILMHLTGIRAKEEMYGAAHPRVADSRRNYAVTLLDAGRPNEAKPIAERALRDGKAALGDDHPAVGISKLVLADVEAKLGHREEAVALYEKVHGIWSGKIPGTHPFWSVLRENHAAVLRALGRDAEAEAVAGGG